MVGLDADAQRLEALVRGFIVLAMGAENPR